MNYRVTASALNIRAAPDATAPRLGVALQGAILPAGVAIDNVPGWVALTWNGHAGFGSSSYLEAVNDTTTALPAAPPAAQDIPPAPPPSKRDYDMTKLHPTVRQKVQDTIAELNAQGLPFRVFEGFRTPERQSWLYAQGRTQPGKIITRAQAWQSMHQYGLAVDIVLFVDNQWSWGGKPADWDQLHAVGKTHGLHALDFEAPHLELDGADWHAYLTGALPPDGDASWLEAVSTAAARWRSNHGTPPGPDLTIPQRPPLPDPQS